MELLIALVVVCTLLILLFNKPYNNYPTNTYQKYPGYYYPSVIKDPSDTLLARLLATLLFVLILILIIYFYEKTRKPEQYKKEDQAWIKEPFRHRKELVPIDLNKKIPQVEKVDL